MTLRELIERLGVIELWNEGRVADAPVFLCVEGETVRSGAGEMVARSCVILSPAPTTKVSGVEDAV